MVSPINPFSQACPDRSQSAWLVWHYLTREIILCKIFEGELSIITQSTNFHQFCSKFLLDCEFYLTSLIAPDDIIQKGVCGINGLLPLEVTGNTMWEYPGISSTRYVKMAHSSQ